jgi:hypothetical protein
VPGLATCFLLFSLVVVVVVVVGLLAFSSFSLFILFPLILLALSAFFLFASFFSSGGSLLGDYSIITRNCDYETGCACFFGSISISPSSSNSSVLILTGDANYGVYSSSSALNVSFVDPGVTFTSLRVLGDLFSVYLASYDAETLILSDLSDHRCDIVASKHVSHQLPTFVIMGILFLIVGPLVVTCGVCLVQRRGKEHANHNQVCFLCVCVSLSLSSFSVFASLRSPCFAFLLF